MPFFPCRLLRRGTALCLLLACGLGSSQGQPLPEQRSLFLQAEQALAKNQQAEVERLLPSLRDYPLYPALQAARLSLEASNRHAMEAFLAQYPWSQAADALRRRWLEALADSGDWTLFFEHYRQGDGKALRCLYHYGQIRSGRESEGYAGGETLWLNGSSLPPACDRLFDALHSAGRLSQEQVWRRFELALRHKKPQLAAAVAAYLPEEGRRAAEWWLKVHEHPQLALDCTAGPVAGELGGRIFVHALDRLASSDVALARSLWLGRRGRYALAAKDVAYMERRLALALALSRRPEAYDALQALPAEGDDEDVRAWRVRAALARQDWRAVLAAWQRLSDGEKSQPEWRYWQARAVEQLGDKTSAEALYRTAAQQRDFFGFLAADRIGGEYYTAHRPAPVEPADWQRLAETPAFRAVDEWRQLGRDEAARAQWDYALHALPAKEALVAAKLAQQWNWSPVAISAAARAGYWDDLALRFPLAYEHTVARHAGQQQLEPSVVYGLIRQESAFDPAARSPAGARGLMQIMPATGQTIAQRLREKLPSVAELFDPDTNLRYGTHFFKELVERFRGNFALAAAAYNAGPQRVRSWLPPEGALPADVWLEQIPYVETRHYVASVLGNTVIYQDRLGNPDKRRLGQFLPDVPAGERKAESTTRVLDCP
jgi:soluble lytic murein transglycosylase